MGFDTTAVLILGMHRSGTSSLTGSLQQHGLNLGKVFEWNPYNRKGNRENQDIMLLNDALLKANGGNWDNPPHSIEWNNELVVKRDAIIQKFIASGATLWGFKDPRAVVTLPFWKDGLNGLCSIKMVGIFRHPLLVAQSLRARTPAMSLSDGLKLWKHYNVLLLSYLEQNEFPIMSFDVSDREYQSSIEYVVEYLGLHASQENSETPFFDAALKNQGEVDGIIQIPDEFIQMYNTLNKIYKRRFTP